MRWLAGLALLLLPLLPGQRATAPALLFSPQELGFTLRNHEGPRKRLPGTMAGGVAAFDYDNDGDLDLYFANGADLASLRKQSPEDHNRLFRNDGGRFTDVTAAAGLAGEGFDIGLAVGDYDNDGCRDLFVAGLRRQSLYRNDCRGRFRDVSATSGLALADAGAWPIGAAWFDLERDGDLDLFVVRYVRWRPETERECLVGGKPDYCHPRFYEASPNALYRNNGDGGFTDVSAESSVGAAHGKGMAAVVADLDQDGLPDVFVTNDREFNFLFRNLGNGRFREQAFDAGVAVPQSGNPPSSMGADFRDLDHDGRPDLLFTALRQETFPLFRNTPGGFEEVTLTSGMAKASRGRAGWGVGFADFDNDTWKDAFAAGSDALSPLGGTGERARETNALFRHLGSLRFIDATPASGLATRPPQMYRGLALGDLDGDGRVDAVVSALNAPAEIWWNRSPVAGHWLAVRLEGRKSNRDGIGARVEVTAGGTTQHDHATTAVGYASSSAGPLHFGLGAATKADRLVVRWPSGTVQTLANVPAGRVLVVREGSVD